METGASFRVGMLEVLSSHSDCGRAFFFVRCDCGKEKEMRQDYIKRCMKNGFKASCGCVRAEKVRMVGYANRKYDYNRRKLYACWKNILARCYDPKQNGYYRYGGRLIEVCLDWRFDIEQFIKDVGMPPTDKNQIDRIDTDGNYGPENVKWSTNTENVRNRSNTRFVTAFGETKPLAEFVEKSGIPYDIVKQRINKLKWPIERALTEERFLGKNQTYSGNI